MAAVTIYSDFGTPQSSLWLFPLFCCLFAVKWWDWMPWSLFFWMLSLEPAFSLSSLTFIKRLFSSSSLSALRMVSSVYLRLLIFLPAVLIPLYASSSPAFCMMYSAYKLNKQGDKIHPWCSPFPVLKQSVPCLVLTVTSWPAYWFLWRQVRWSDIPLSFRIFRGWLWSTLSEALA